MESGRGGRRWWSAGFGLAQWQCRRGLSGQRSVDILGLSASPKSIQTFNCGCWGWICMPWRWHGGKTLRRCPARSVPTSGVASNRVHRHFDATQPPPPPNRWQRHSLAQSFPGSVLLTFPGQGSGLVQLYKWPGSHRCGILHLLTTCAFPCRQQTSWPNGSVVTGSTPADCQ